MKKTFVIPLIILCMIMQVAISAGIKFSSQQPWFLIPWANYLTYFICIIVYAMYAFLWQHVLKYTDLSRANSIMSLTVLFVFLTGILLFNEPFNVYSIVGVLLLVSGLILIARSKNP